MKKLSVILIWCLSACQNHSRETKKEEATNIFPVVSFFSGQIHKVDSLKLPITKYTIVNEKTDSVTITTDEFKLLANEFMKPDITGADNKKFYKESSFADQSIPSITITYSTTFRDLEIQRIDVIINPDPVADDKVQSIYMEKLSHNHDTSILKKLFWRTDQNFQIITSNQVGNHPATFNQLKVEWSHED